MGCCRFCTWILAMIQVVFIEVPIAHCSVHCRNEHAIRRASTTDAVVDAVLYGLCARNDRLPSTNGKALR